LEDLSAINYRLQGLVEKKHETQETMLVNRSKIRVGSGKRVWDGSDCKESKDLGGYAGTCKTHKIAYGFRDCSGA
jgi:hypothetical protein